MSAGVETVKACPRGHTHLTRRDPSTERMHGAEPKSEFYCESCRYNGQPHHYELEDLIEKPRRVNPHLEYDVKTGYVWSPSHDEVES